jgi:putative transposase
MKRKVELATGQHYHIFNKSIAGFKIFNFEKECERMLDMIRYYQWSDLPCSFAQFLRLDQVKKIGFEYSLVSLSHENQKLVEIIAYCLMPTHVHFIVKQLVDNGWSEPLGLDS